MSFGLLNGRMLSYSKSEYRSLYPKNEVYFNANIFILGEGKIWYGDIDLSLDLENLSEVAATIGKPLFILRESDGRFGREDLSDSEILKLSVRKIEI